MRPRSEIRAALASAFGEQGASSWLAVLPATGADPRSRSEVVLVRKTVENMVQAGELVPCGREKLQGERVWRSMYELVDPLAEAPPSPQTLSAAETFNALAGITRSWATFD